MEAKEETKEQRQADGDQTQEERAAEIADAGYSRKQFRIQASAVLLTYHGFKDLAQWRRFLEHVKSKKKQWKVKHWCATLEATKKGALHVHVMLQFTRAVDRCNGFFSFEDLPPRADPCDLLGEGFCRNKMQQSIDRAMFYCFADKEGTQRDENGKVCTAGNYWPVWVEDATFTYTVVGRWPENLWKARKLSHATWKEYLYLCRDGVCYRKRNLDTVVEHEEAEAEQKEMEAVVKRIRSNFSQPFPKVAAADAWLQTLQEESDRYAFLLVLGPSRAGKTEWAKSLFKSPLELKVGTLEQFPEGMRAFSRKRHDGIILDDVRDLYFLVRHQEKLQGKYDYRVEFGTTPGGQCAFHKWLWKVPVVATANFTTLNRHLLNTDDFLGNSGNRVVVNFPPTA